MGSLVLVIIAIFCLYLSYQFGWIFNNNWAGKHQTSLAMLLQCSFHWTLQLVENTTRSTLSSHTYHTCLLNLKCPVTMCMYSFYNTLALTLLVLHCKLHIHVPVGVFVCPCIRLWKCVCIGIWQRAGSCWFQHIPGGIQSKDQACWVAAAFALAPSIWIIHPTSFHPFDFPGKKQVERKLKDSIETEGKKKKKAEKRFQIWRISSARDFHVFEPIHNQLTCPWLDSYLWVASMRVRVPITTEL